MSVALNRITRIDKSEYLFLSIFSKNLSMAPIPSISIKNTKEQDISFREDLNLS